MGLLVLPVALIPTLKESSSAAFVGCLGTIVSDVIAIAVLLYQLDGHPSVPAPDVTFHQVVTSFGNLSLAYGAAIIIPDLQRQHSEPKRMPRVVLVSLGLASTFFLALAIVGYSAGGCQISANILFSIANTSNPSATTSLGFIANRGAVIMAFMFMQLHLSIAYSTILQPAFYMLECLFLGMHKNTSAVIDSELEGKISLNGARPPVSPEVEFSALETSRRIEYTSVICDETEYKGAKQVARYVPARMLLLAVQTGASIAFRDHFLDLVDFTGATFITVCCLILPLVLYLKVLWKKLPIYEKTISLVVILVCGSAGIYVMIYAGKNLFSPDSSSATFPYCSEEYQTRPYYVKDTMA